MKAVPVVAKMSIKDEFAARDRLREEADAKLPALAEHLLSVIPRRLDLFRTFHRWDRHPETGSDWQFPMFIESIVYRSTSNLAIEYNAPRHALHHFGFKNYRTFCYHLNKLAEAWREIIDISITFHTSDNKKISERAFNKREDDLSAYMKISFYAAEFLYLPDGP